MFTSTNIHLYIYIYTSERGYPKMDGSDLYVVLLLIGTLEEDAWPGYGTYIGTAENNNLTLPETHRFVNASPVYLCIRQVIRYYIHTTHGLKKISPRSEVRAAALSPSLMPRYPSSEAQTGSRARRGPPPAPRRCARRCIQSRSKGANAASLRRRIENARRDVW